MFRRFALTAGCLCLFAVPVLAAAPVIFHANDPVGPGDSVLVIGNGFGAHPVVHCGRVVDAATFPVNKLPVVQASDQSLKFTLPANWKPGVYLFTVTGPGGQSKWWYLNQPVVWWEEGDQGTAASPGGWLRLFGKNLGWTAKSKYVTTVLLKGKRTVRLKAEEDCWNAKVMVPRNLPAGSYQVSVSNGCGDSQTWSQPMAVTIAKPTVWPQTVYDVTKFGANGNDTSDDTAAFQAALDKAGKAGGGIVYVPRGRYEISSGLVIPRFTALRGEKENRVCLYWPDMDNPPDALIQGTNSFALENLTIYTTHQKNIIVGDLGNVPDAGNIHLWRVRVRADVFRGHLTADEVDARLRALQKIGGGDTVRMGGRNIAITDCDFYGSGRALYLSRVTGGRVTDNQFYNGRWGWYCISGSDGLIFENNRITGADLMSTGGGLNCLDGSNYSQNVYYAGNKLSLMHGWDREAMTSDAGGGLYYGPIAEAKGTKITLPEAPKTGSRNWAGAGVFIFSGKGWAQYRRVVSAAGDTVTVDRPWDVAPDSTSLIGITMLQRHYLVIGNQFSDAGISVQFYGCSVDHIVAGNTCRRAGGYQAIGKPYGGYRLPPDKNPCHQPSWFCQFLDNTIAEGAIYRSGANNSILSGESVIGIYGWPLTKDWKWPYNVGAVVRGNHLDNNAHIQIGGSGNELPSVRDVIVEDNIVKDSDNGIRLDRATAGVLLRGNQFVSVRDPIDGDGASGAWMDGNQRAAAALAKIRSVAQDAGVTADPASWLQVRQALDALRAASNDPQKITAATGALTLATLEQLAARTQHLPLASVRPLVGLNVEVASESTLPAVLQGGKGGEATLVLRVASRRDAPALTIAAAPEFPFGWQTLSSAPATPLAAGGQVTLTVKVQVPAGTWGRQELPVVLLVSLPRATLRLTDRITVGTGVLRDWMVIGPFANRSGQPLDLSLYPPEDGIDLGGEYDGAAGKVRWQPVRLSGDWLDLNKVLRHDKPGVAYAVACITATEQTSAVLHIGSSGGTAVLLNGQYLWSANVSRKAVPDQDQVPLTLRQGDNVLLCKLSTDTAQWRFTAELTPPSGASGFSGNLRVVPPDSFRGRQCFVPPPVQNQVTGEIKHAAGVHWRLVYSDDFDRDTLGARWRPALGKWSCQGGLLTASGDKAFLAYAAPVAAPVRIEYDTRTPGQSAGDLSAFWLSDPANYASGYLIGFGSNGNTLNKALINGEQAAGGERPLVKPGKWHHVIAQILADGRVQLVIDDQLSLNCAGPAPGQPKFPGLWTWGDDGVFAKVRIYSGE